MRLLPVVILALALCSSCQIGGADRNPTAMPEDALLVDVSPAERTRVSTARVAHGKAKDVLAAAERQHAMALSEQSAGKQQHTAALAKVAWSKTALARSESTGTTADVEAAQQELRTAENSRDVQVDRCELRDREVVEAERQEELAAALVALSLARLDLAKAVAVSTLDRPEAQKPDVARFEALVREAEGKENVARANLATASREVEIGRSKLADRAIVR